MSGPEADGPRTCAADGNGPLLGLDGGLERFGFRCALRQIFQTVLERLSAEGAIAIAPEEMPALIEQVRETRRPEVW